MYQSLLGVALAERHASEPARSAEELVRELRELRVRMTALDGAAALGLAGDLAIELRHDLALVELCEVVGVPTDLARFDRPLIERGRLIAELEGAGFVLTGDPAA